MFDTQNTLWFLRFHFALLLLVFGELVAWQDAATYTPLDWLAVLGIYLGLAAILLDLVARLHINDWKSLLLLAGVFGLLHALLISLVVADPNALEVDLIFRPLGLEVLMFLLAFGSFRLLHSGRSSGIFAPMIAAFVALGWGIWTRWFPTLDGDAPYTLGDTLPWVVLGLAIGGILPRLLYRDHTTMEPEDWQLSPYEWGAAGGMIVVALFLRLQYVSTFGASITASLIFFLLFMLYFSREMRRSHYLQGITPPKPAMVVGWLVALLFFALFAALSFQLPGDVDRPQYASFLFRALTAFGVAWVPLVSALMGIGLYAQLIREGF